MTFNGINPFRIIWSYKYTLFHPTQHLFYFFYFNAAMRGKFNNFTIILVCAPTEERDKLVKDFFYDKLNQIYQRIPAHDTEIIVGDFNAKSGREEVFKLDIGKCSLHATSNENVNSAIDFAPDDVMIIKGTYFPHKNVHKETWQSPDGITNNQVDHVDERHTSSIMDVRSYRGVGCYWDYHLVQIKYQHKISKEV